MNSKGWSDPRAMDVVSPVSVAPEVSWQGKSAPVDSSGLLFVVGDEARAGVDISIWPFAIAARPQEAAKILKKPIVSEMYGCVEAWGVRSRRMILKLFV
jgi:hypothetical protein